VIPVPGHAEGTPYGARSRLWSCSRNAAGEGIHTGVDFPAPVGTTVVAARPGIAVYADHGSAFGSHQLEIRCPDGTRDFYAHMTTRLVANGAHVDAGQRVGRVGEEGNVTGPHLHFERHRVATGIWSCAVVTNPTPSVLWKPPAPKEIDMPLNKDDLAAIRTIVAEEVSNVLDADMNAQEPAGSPAFRGVTLRGAIKAIYRKVGAGS
jgi:murein DD-endopeptidase MepM/ murein hydrolase activator NlpD